MVMLIFLFSRSRCVTRSSAAGMSTVSPVGVFTSKSVLMVVDGVAHNLRPGQFAVVLFCEASWEKHLTPCESCCLTGVIDIAEFHERCRVASESVFLHEKRHKESLYLQEEVFSIDTVEDIISEME